MTSSSPKPWGRGTVVIPGTLPYSGVLLAVVASPGLLSPVFPTQSLWDSPGALKPPDSAASPHPLAVPKHDLAADVLLMSRSICVMSL